MIRSCFHCLGHALRTFNGMYQRRYSAQWDRLLNQLLDEGALLDWDAHCATFDYQDAEYRVWIANRWYAYGHLDSYNGEPLPRKLQWRPRFRTMLRLHAVSSQITEAMQAEEEAILRCKLYGGGDKS